MGIHLTEETEEKIREGLDTAVETFSAGIGSASGFTSGRWSMICNTSCDPIQIRQFLHFCYRFSCWLNDRIVCELTFSK